MPPLVVRWNPTGTRWGSRATATGGADGSAPSSTRSSLRRSTAPSTRVSSRTVADLQRPVTGVLYFGDLDGKGLRIPHNAAEIAEEEELPPVVAATPLYRLAG